MNSGKVPLVGCRDTEWPQGGRTVLHIARAAVPCERSAATQSCADSLPPTPLDVWCATRGTHAPERVAPPISPQHAACPGRQTNHLKRKIGNQAGESEADQQQVGEDECARGIGDLLDVPVTPFRLTGVPGRDDRQRERERARGMEREGEIDVGLRDAFAES